MQRRNKIGAGRSRSARLLTIAALGAALGAGGCEDYMKRRDPVTLGVGDSIAANKATQTINRWPRAAYEDRWVTDGTRAGMAVKRYKTDTVKDPKSLNAKAPAAVPEQAESVAPGTK